MKNMEQDFLPRLNAFSELLKDTHRLHAEHILKMSNVQKQLTNELKQILPLLEAERMDGENAGNPDIAVVMEEYKGYCESALHSFKAYRAIFQQHIDDTNFQLGQFSTMWGGYIEHLSAQYIQNLLRREFGAHTFMQRYKLWWHKSSNLEIDLLGLSDTHAYILEVKNQLKEDTFKQMLTIIDKMKVKLPDIAAMHLQPIFVCVHATPQMVNTATMSGIWVIRYKGFDDDDPVHGFEWLRKDPEQTEEE